MFRFDRAGCIIQYPVVSFAADLSGSRLNIAPRQIGELFHKGFTRFPFGSMTAVKHHVPVFRQVTAEFTERIFMFRQIIAVDYCTAQCEVPAVPVGHKMDGIVLCFVISQIIIDRSHRIAVFILQNQHIRVFFQGIHDFLRTVNTAADDHQFLAVRTHRNGRIRRSGKTGKVQGIAICIFVRRSKFFHIGFIFRFFRGISGREIVAIFGVGRSQIRFIFSVSNVFGVRNSHFVSRCVCNIKSLRLRIMSCRNGNTRTVSGIIFPVFRFHLCFHGYRILHRICSRIISRILLLRNDLCIIHQF